MDLETRFRDLGVQGFQKESAPSVSLCERRSSIDFRKIFDVPFSTRSYAGPGILKVVNLGFIEPDAEASHCRLCRLCSKTNYYPCESIDEPGFTRPRPQLAGYPSNRANNPLPLQFGVTVSDVRNRLNEYSQRELTYESDALNAIAGVLSAFVTRNVLDGHIWGIPVIKGLNYHRPGGNSFRLMPLSDKIAHGLCWTPNLSAARMTQNPIRRRDGFPSWSWVGWVDCRSWEYLTPVNDRIGWPANQPHVEPSRYSCSFTFVSEDGFSVTLDHEQNDARFDLDMQSMSYVLVQAWSFYLKCTEERPEISTRFSDAINSEHGEIGLTLWMGQVLWNKDYERDTAFHRHILDTTWRALVIGYGVIHPSLDIVIVEDVGDHFERAGILRLLEHRPQRIGPDRAVLLNAGLKKDTFKLG
ncbi:hypothetical protein BDV96DRAFT_690233 [Lophiotrema nucula]|uniref:Heterokaryon incompatibility domain-containing protein n=1 Tax=Lophiotrema nucula TaxID=690887 RepID=A0A6A5YZ81_9PLEO|nr:hypothetical protein BDV96DRAFT_690233 [Lophiotrema nucula]